MFANIGKPWLKLPDFLKPGAFSRPRTFETLLRSVAGTTPDEGKPVQLCPDGDPRGVVSGRLQSLVPISFEDRVDHEYQRIALHLWVENGGTYARTKIVNLIVEISFRAEKGRLAETFVDEKAALRKMVSRFKPTSQPEGIRKSEGQLPSPTTFENNINSLEPIYQRIRNAFATELEPIR